MGMIFTENKNTFGVLVKEIPCITGNGAPTTETVGAVGVLYMDKNNGDVYKCISAKDNTYTWVTTDSNRLYTDEKYFGITDSGEIYLQPEYRGWCPSAQAAKEDYAYAVSDLGAEQDGSKNKELPEIIIIPEMIGETPVNGLVKGMFLFNLAIRRVILPKNITEIPNGCFYGSYDLEEVSGTENVIKIGQSAFMMTNIKKAIFPKLESMATQCFSYCPMLCVADIGNMASVPKGTFFKCIRLHTLRNGQNVDTVGNMAFADTSRLKNPEFLSNLKDIGDEAFLYSRVYHDWKSLQDGGCKFGNNSTILQYNPTDYWSGKTFEEHVNTIRSTFDQNNPLWVNEPIVEMQSTWGDGCTMCACAVIYSAYEGKDLASPAEFITAALEKDPTLTQYTIGYKETQIKYLEAMGYTVEVNNADTGAELTVGRDLQYMYDSIAAGHLIYLGVIAGNAISVSHCVVIYGINENGELLVVDSNGKASNSGVYKANIHPMPVQNITKDICDFMVVKKN